MSDSAFSFDRIAHSYDRLNHLLSLDIDRWWRYKAVKQLTACHRLLDVAIGTGDLAIEICRQQKAREVVGIDLSEEMMAIGRQKVAERQIDSILFQKASAQDMPFEDNSFDAATCSYGVRNFTDLDKGLSEMHRVIKENGEVLILEFSYPSNRLIRCLYDIYFRYVLPWVGRYVSGDKTAYRYLNQSVEHFIWGEQMAQRLRKAGFREVEYMPMTFGITTIYKGKK